MKDDSFAEIVAREGLHPPRASESEFSAAKVPARAGTLPPPDDGDDSPFADKTMYAANGIDLRRLRNLLKQNPEEVLDLHGMTAAEAHSALENFLREQAARGRRRLEIVHGRGAHSADGRAVLRAKTRKWLAGCDAVLGFIAPPDNPGAVRVLLRRSAN